MLFGCVKVSVIRYISRKVHLGLVLPSSRRSWCHTHSAARWYLLAVSLFPEVSACRLGYFRGQACLGHQRFCPELLIIPQGRLLCLQQVLQLLACFPPCWPSKAHEGSERRLQNKGEQSLQLYWSARNNISDRVQVLLLQSAEVFKYGGSSQHEKAATRTFPREAGLPTQLSEINSAGTTSNFSTLSCRPLFRIHNLATNFPYSQFFCQFWQGSRCEQSC